MFSKALVFADVHAAFLPLVISVPVVLGLAIALLEKQAA
jgi:ribosome-dependent ATPase